MYRMTLVVGSVVFAWLLSGCATNNAVPSSGPRQPTTPDQVVIYPKQPDSKYEVLGTVTVPVGGDVRWDDRGESAAGFDLLKAHAATLGANGLLLELDEASYDLIATVGYRGTFYAVPIKRDPKRAVATAIYVLPK